MAFAVLSPAMVRSRAFQMVSWSPQRLAVGSPCLFTVEISVLPISVNGKWQERDLTFFPSENHHVWYALAGIDVAARPGRYTLQLEATLPGGKVIREQRRLLIARPRFATEALRVPDQFVEPDAEARVHIAADEQLKKTAFSHSAPRIEWSGNFRPPIDSSVSEAFGTRRTFNGKLASIHRGLDYRAAPGSPVVAANSGEVVLARELFYEGKCVIIDHGQQFMSIYMHLSQVDVSEGQKVEKGQEIGLSGATGRVTGPHLHTAVRWQGSYLDPAKLWALPLPALQTTAESGVSAR